MKKVYGMLSVVVGASLFMGGQAFAAGNDEGNGNHHNFHRHHSHQSYDISKLPKEAQYWIRYANQFDNYDGQSDTELDYTPAKKHYKKPVVKKPKKAIHRKVAQPKAAQPKFAQPDVAQPKVAKPVVAKPAVTKPVVAKPVVSEPVVAKPVTAKPVVNHSTQGATANDTASQVIAAGEKYMGTPYKFGSSSSTTSTFDCSSFTQRAFKDAGISLPRDSRQQSTVGQAVSIDQLQKGDLVFFRTSGSSSDRITHVAIYAGNDQLLHTFGKGGVTYTKFNGTNWEKRFVTARRVI